MRPSTNRADLRISVVVPCYNRAGYVNALLQSISWSTVPRSDFEVIVINDGGVDHLELIVEAWRRVGLDVRVLQLRASGPPRNNAAARNAGIREARYPVVVQTDPDIVFASDVLQRVRETLQPGTFCSCSAYYPLTREATLDLAFGVGGPRQFAAAYLAHAVGRPNQVLSPDGVGGLHGAFACAKADVLRVGGYDESFTHWGWEDRELLVTLASDGGLTRCYMPETAVVHLWHPPLRADTARDELAARGQWSRVAWDVQMQRVSAEYPRSTRPRLSCAANSVTQTVFSRDAYGDWTSGLTDQAFSARPLVYQLFFDAQCAEAAQLRSSGYVSVARDLLRCTLARPWESHRLERSTYEHLDSALEDLASCEEELGNLDARDALLAELAVLPGGVETVRTFRARSALRNGDLQLAREEVDRLGSWTVGRTALGIEIALLTGQLEKACNLVEENDQCGNYFERLRLEAYCALLGNLTSGTVCNGMSVHEEERSEFLYSSAMRSVAAGFDIAACLLLSRFLRSGSPAEDRLYEEGRKHLDAARERISRKATPDWAASNWGELLL